MTTILHELAERPVKAALRANWENYHYCLGQARNAELSIGRCLNWLMTDLPDHFINLVISTQRPRQDPAELIDQTLTHFLAMKMRRFSTMLACPVKSVKPFGLSDFSNSAS